MTEEEKEVYNIVADWWDDVFVRPQNPNTIRKISITNLVNAIIERKECDN